MPEATKSAASAAAPAPAAPMVNQAPAKEEAPAASQAAPAPAANQDPAEVPADKPVDPEKPVDKPNAPDGDAVVQVDAAPAAPRWFGLSMKGAPNVVNVLAVDAKAAVERYKIGQGIRSTPHDIDVRANPVDYVPTAADLDYHGAIEKAAADSKNAALAN